MTAADRISAAAPSPVASPGLAADDPLSPGRVLARPGQAALAVLGAGAAATVAFDLYGQAISPLLGGAALAPVPLARQTLQTLFGWDSAGGAHLLHYIAGLLAYPLGWLLIARPLARRLVPALPELAAAALWGVALWIFALGIMAGWVNGNPFMLGFIGITWVALAGHVLFALVCAWALRRTAGGGA
ncbi:hypothetical protein P2H44_06640 [Albimonas sp. CAU 1670]|uniref:hypothetical protein n=1 Tax=Albimonas sp. CAU 1670 TaxID=3032599 RepID=UPI0023DC061C|nr:hypothetical protein [Albimonas sp. CAU 1670]MDF2232228.1 hypothetical protein [Albimonas sp. CAU 1670]